MRGPWTALVVFLSLGSAPVFAGLEPPSNEEQPSDTGGNDASESVSSPADSSPSSGGEVAQPDSGDARGSYSDWSSPADRERDRRDYDDRPRPRDSSEWSGRQGEHHHSRGSRASGGSSDTSASSGELSSRADTESAEPPPTDAQRRHPRAGTGTGDRMGRGANRPPFDSGDQDYPDDSSLGGNYGYSPFEFGGFYGYAPDYYRNRYRDGGLLRLNVDPGQTRVFIDGFYAGTADEFDGTFQSLYLPPGTHEIALLLDGYRMKQFALYVSANRTITVRHVMERAPEEREGPWRN